MDYITATWKEGLVNCCTQFCRRSPECWGTNQIRSARYGVIAYLSYYRELLVIAMVMEDHGCFISIEPVTKRLRPVIRNFFIATDLITTLATNMGLKMLPFTTRTVLNSSFDFGSYFYIVWRSEQCELIPLICCE